ncbi:efflux RND transporter periplasmic adaptor subunit [Heliobacillus mobilis]|uniref:Efflux RND transporter periplasmic adaptor subunit n=1 Tax=Heliobacterium mobile TaxID=28064 RepID=A0A6I3SJZ6_HELMO|nr:efflux RND transporter periplasmic adaptor subunit [Heliobacterium mobile]MTV49248.1 efflux RND transporter periplasmic adaptor subunit [Heliobacterium mobile]
MKKEMGVGLLALVLLTAGTACGKQTEAPTAEAAAQTVSLAKVQRASLSNRLTFNGTLEAKEELKLVPKGTGKVAHSNGEVGQMVRAGDVLMELDNADIQARLDSAKAGVAVNEANLQKAQVQLEMDQIALDDAQRNYERQKALFEAGAAPKTEFENSKSAYDTAVKRVANDQASIASAQAQMQQSQAQIRQIEVELNDTILRSPVTGIIADRSANTGEYVSNTNPAFTVVNIDTVEVKANLTETDINYVKTGQEVEVKITAARTEPFKGRITKISPIADEKSKTYPIWISIDNHDYILKPGMFAEFQLNTNQKTDVLTVPTEAIIERNGTPMIYLAVEGKAVEKKVHLGITDGKLVEILDGITENDKIITSGLKTLTDGVAIAEQGSTQTAPAPAEQAPSGGQAQ